MFDKIWKFGLIAGLLAGVPLSIIVITMGHQDSMMTGMLIGYTIMLVALSTIFVAVKRYRDVDRGGVVRFLPALGMGLAISAVAGVIYVIAWESSVAIAHLDFASGYAKMMVDGARAKGASGAALAKVIAEADAFKAQYANPLYRWPETFSEIFPVGVIVSLISAGLLRNSRFLPARRAATAA